MFQKNIFVSVTAAIAVMVFAQGCASKKKAEPPAATAKEATAPAAAKPDAKAAPTPSLKSAGKVECSVTGDTRVIEVVETASSGCEVMYTKAGTVEKIGSSANGKTYCESLSAKVRSNLESAGFTCK